MSRYEVRLLGEQAKLGEIPAGDVGKSLVGVQGVLARAAGAAIGRRTKFVGDVTYDALSNKIKSVRLRRLSRTEQLLLGEEATMFWQDRTAEELVEEQGTRPVATFADLRDTSMSDEEFESFLASLD